MATMPGPDVTYAHCEGSEGNSSEDREVLRGSPFEFETTSARLGSEVEAVGVTVTAGETLGLETSHE